MVSATRLAVFAVLLSVLVLPPSADGQADPWAKLKYRTGWTALGDIDSRSPNLWVTQLKFVIRERTSDSQSRIPEIGDVIEATDRMQLRIIGYQTSVEDRRLQSPGGRVATPEDETGIWLPPGTRMVVRDVAVHPFQVGWAESVWVRVEPYP